MNELIRTIEEHKDNNNEEVCEDLIDFIKSFKIENLEDLLVYENKFFSSDKLSDKLHTKYISYQNDTSYYEFLELSSIDKAKEYEEKYLEATDELEKCKYLILLLNEIQRDLFFPYEAYLLIERDELK